MEILETIPIYGVPNWPIITLFVGIGIVIFAAGCLHDTEYVGLIVGMLGVIAVVGSLLATVVLHESEFKHNEYIIRLTDISAQEFTEKYEVTKRFEYSDVIQVKEIGK